MAQTTASALLHVGFLAIVQENTGYLGGYLVTNQWGRPLEFRLSTAVQPNRIQHILYGKTLLGYICGDLIGKALVEKSTVPAQLVVTDHPEGLKLQPHVGAPVLHLGANATAVEGADPLVCIRHHEDKKRPIFGHADMPGERSSVLGLLDRLERGFDLNEPFARIREALAEARKMGVTARG